MTQKEVVTSGGAGFLLTRSPMKHLQQWVMFAKMTCQSYGCEVSSWGWVQCISFSRGSPRLTPAGTLEFSRQLMHYGCTVHDKFHQYWIVVDGQLLHVQAKFMLLLQLMMKNMFCRSNVFCIILYFVHIVVPMGISPMGNLGRLPQEKPAATVTLPNPN